MLLACVPQGENVTRLASMAKLKVGRLGRELSDACLQYFGACATRANAHARRALRRAAPTNTRDRLYTSVAGGNGYMEENYVTRCYRDWRLISIGGGADEVMLSILSKIQQERFHGRRRK